MDKAILGLTIVMTFSVAYERALELARRLGEKLIPRSSTTLKQVADGATAGPFATIGGMGLAIVTNANLVDAFRYMPDGETRFFENYLAGPAQTPSAIVGCIAMGLAVSLGAQFWHDFVKGLMDLRSSLQAVRPTPEKLLAEAIVPIPPAIAPGRQGLI